MTDLLNTIMRVFGFCDKAEMAEEMGAEGWQNRPRRSDLLDAIAWPTTGGRHKHPYQEADETISRVQSLAAPSFDEFLILQFSATNSPPYPFSRVDPRKTAMDYGAALARVSSKF
jgi:hypothetical protein